MTQLQEYLEQRKRLQARMKECREAAFDHERGKTERREANRRFNQYADMLTGKLPV